MTRSAVRFLGALATSAALAIVALAPATQIANAATTLSPAERSFSVAYEKLVPRLDDVNVAIDHALSGATKKTDAQIAGQFTTIARKWKAATQPLFALHPPAREAADVALIRHFVPLVEGDLRQIASSGRLRNVKLAKSATKSLLVHLSALGGVVGRMKELLNLN